MYKLLYKYAQKGMNIKTFIFEFISNILMHPITNIIGHGRYSVVLSPGIMHSNNWILPYCDCSDDDVFKIFYSDESKEEFDDEFNVLLKIKTIQKYDSFTAPIKGACKICVKDIPHEIKQIILKYNANIENQEYIYQIIYGFSGTSLCTVKLKSKSYNEWLIIIKNLLLGIQLVHEKGIIHRDITPANVLYDFKANELKLIDFGLGIDATHVFNNQENTMFMLSSMYMFSPPEFFFTYLMHSKLEKEENFIDCFKSVFYCLTNNTHLLRSFYKKHFCDNNHNKIYQISDYTNGFRETLQTIDFQSCSSVRDIFSKDIAYKCDVYAISYLFQYIESSINFQNIYERQHFSILMEKTSCFNPFERATLAELISYIDQYLQDYSF
jgi:serine/threonine protein kinase